MKMAVILFTGRIESSAITGIGMQQTLIDLGVEVPIYSSQPQFLITLRHFLMYLLGIEKRIIFCYFFLQ